MNNLKAGILYQDDDNIIFGNNTILCYGRCITGNEVWTRITAILFILLPCIYFNFTILPWYYSKYGSWVPALVILLDTIVAVSYILVSTSDPGIIPRHDSSRTYYDPQTRTKTKGIIPYIEVPINGLFLRIKFCSTCNIYRNPRTIHCNSCNVCVDRLDHHCKWLGNCIGSRNYALFFLNITITCLLTICMQILCCYRIAIASIYKEHDGIIGIVHASLCIAVLMIISISLLGLAIYHTYLICTNQTTNEHLKGTYGEFNPWDRGTLKNIQEMLFTTKTSKHYYHPYIKNTIYSHNHQTLDHLIENIDIEMNGNAAELTKLNEELNKSVKQYNIKKKFDFRREAPGKNGKFPLNFRENLTKTTGNAKNSKSTGKGDRGLVTENTHQGARKIVEYTDNPLFDLTKSQGTASAKNEDNNEVNSNEEEKVSLNSTVVSKNIEEICSAICE